MPDLPQGLSFMEMLDHVSYSDCATCRSARFFVLIGSVLSNVLILLVIAWLIS